LRASVSGLKEPTCWLSHPTKTDSSRARNGRKPKCLRIWARWWRWVRSLHSPSKYASAGTPIWLARCATTLLVHICTSIGKSSVELERFQQRGEAETSYPRLVTEQFEFVWIERPTLGEFVGMPRPFHGLRRCPRLKL